MRKHAVFGWNKADDSMRTADRKFFGSWSEIMWSSAYHFLKFHISVLSLIELSSDIEPCPETFINSNVNEIIGMHDTIHTVVI